jgi:hypothetical protein
LRPEILGPEADIIGGLVLRRKIVSRSIRERERRRLADDDPTLALLGGPGKFLDEASRYQIAPV